MTSKVHQRTKPPGRMNVRVDGLMRTLESFNGELGQRIVSTMAQYDRQRVVPLARRLAWLEKPLVVRAWLRCGQAWMWLYSGRALAQLKAKFAKLPPPVPETPKEPPVKTLEET